MMSVFPPSEPVQEIVSDGNLMIKTPEARTAVIRQPPASETDQQRFERILLRPQFKPLKAVFDNLGIAVPVMQAAIVTTNSYQMFLSKLGYRVVLVKHIHENDCYARLGPKGGIRAVLPVHDTATYSTMVTLVNFDATVTTTANSVDFYDRQLAEFKTQLMNRSGNAV
jgi:hypothetical protein